MNFFILILAFIVAVVATMITNNNQAQQNWLFFLSLPLGLAISGYLVFVGIRY